MSARRPTTAVLLAVLALGPACAHAPRAGPCQLPIHFAVVDAADHIYRGGQPTAAEWLCLRAYGVTRSVKLNYVPEGAPRGIDVRLHSMPPEGLATALNGPTLRDLLSAVADVVPGTYVHCDHGQDRTGLVVATWRVLHGSRPGDAADEALALGYHVELLGLDRAWEQFLHDRADLDGGAR